MIEDLSLFPEECCCVRYDQGPEIVSGGVFVPKNYFSTH